MFFLFREGVVQLGLLPFYHIYAVMASFLSSLAWGQTSVIVPGFDPRNFLEIVPKYKVHKQTLRAPFCVCRNIRSAIL